MNFLKKTDGHFLSQACWLLVSFFLAFSFKQYFQENSFLSFVLENVCNPGKVGIRDYALSKGIKSVRLKIRKSPYYYILWHFRQTIARYIRQYARGGKISQNEITND